MSSSTAAAAASLYVEIPILALFCYTPSGSLACASTRLPALHFPPRYRNREREPSLSVSLMAKGKNAKPAGE